MLIQIKLYLIRYKGKMRLFPPNLDDDHSKRFLYRIQGKVISSYQGRQGNGLNAHHENKDDALHEELQMVKVLRIPLSASVACFWG